MSAAPPSPAPWPRRLHVALAVAMLALILLATLVPSSDPDSGLFQRCVLCGEFGLADAIANVLLFLPLAIGVYGAGASAGRTVLLGFLLSASLEYVQLRLIPGRDATLGDVVWNTAGMALGVALARWLPMRRRSGVHSLGASVLVLSAIGCFGFVLLPSFPPTVYYGQWTADLGQYEWYRGRVLSAEIGGMAMPSWRLADSKKVAELLAAGTPLRVRAIAGPRTERQALIFSIMDAAHREIVIAGPDRDDLVLHVSTRSVDVRLQQPDLRWRGAMAGVRPGDTLRVEVRRVRGEYCLRLNERERCGLAPTAGRAWTLVQFVPHLPAVVQTVLDGVFLVLLGLPIGLVYRRGAAGYTALALALGGLVGVPPLVALAPTPLLQVAALALGILAGAHAPPAGVRTAGRAD